MKYKIKRFSNPKTRAANRDSFRQLGINEKHSKFMSTKEFRRNYASFIRKSLMERGCPKVTRADILIHLGRQTKRLNSLGKIALGTTAVVGGASFAKNQYDKTLRSKSNPYSPEKASETYSKAIR